MPAETHISPGDRNAHPETPKHLYSDNTVARANWTPELAGNNLNRCSDYNWPNLLRISGSRFPDGNGDGSTVAAGAAEQTVLSLIARKGCHRNTRPPTGDKSVKFEVPAVIAVCAGDGDTAALAGEGADGGEAVNHGSGSSSLVFSIRLPA